MPFQERENLFPLHLPCGNKGAGINSRSFGRAIVNVQTGVFPQKKQETRPLKNKTEFKKQDYMPFQERGNLFPLHHSPSPKTQKGVGKYFPTPFHFH